MTDTEQILELLEKKRVYFLHYEKEMEALPLLAVEELEPCVERGAKIIEKIEELDAKLNQLLQQKGPLAQSAANHRCDRAQLDAELGRVYDAALAVKAVASRILQNDGMIRERIAYERQQALEKIKEINRRPTAVVGRYRQAARPGAAIFFPESPGREA